MPKYKKCADCGGIMKYCAGTTKSAQAAVDEYKCTNKHCGKSYPASPDERKAYGAHYPRPGK